MTKKIVMFFDERLNTSFRIVRFGKCIPVREEEAGQKPTSNYQKKRAFP